MKILRRSVFAAFVVMLAVAMSLFVIACKTDEPENTTVGYSVEVWLESGEDFTKSDEYSYSGSGEVGKAVTITPAEISDYEFDSENSGNVLTLTLSENESENLFKLYYKAETGTPENTVGYSVEVWLESGEDFTKSDEYSYSESGEVGETVTVTPAEISGYEFDSENSGNVLTLTLSEDEGENLFKLYYKAETVTEDTVGYSVEVWLESEGDFTKSNENSYTNSGKIGATVTVTPAEISGYEFDSENSGNVLTLTLSEDESENLFKLYYKAETAPRVVYYLRYNANAPMGTTVRGSVADTEVAEDGTATVANNNFSVEGYRFAGWSTNPTGTAQYLPGETISVTETTVLYAVWDVGYVDRYGSSDTIFVLSSKVGVVVLRRGSVEFEGTINGALFTVKVSNTTTYNGKIYSDSVLGYSFAYERPELAGTYSFHSSYYNPDDPNGEAPIQDDDTLIIDQYGEGTHHYVNEITNAVTDDVGFVSYLADTNEYLFYITQGSSAGSGFLFKTEVISGKAVFSTTFGEFGIYYEATTADGIMYMLAGNALLLDGYGTITYQDYYYSGEFTGYYWVEGVYGDGVEFFIYKIHARVKDDANHVLDRLGYNVVDGYALIDFYTMPISNTMYLYVEPHFEAGEYESANGETLVLDGYKTFADSAKYIDADGIEHTGSYEVTVSQRDGLIITLTESNEYGEYNGRMYYFSLPWTSTGIDNTFSIYNRADSATEYVLLDSTDLNYELLLLIYEDAYLGVANAVKAELMAQTRNGYEIVASGYVTFEFLKGGNAMLYKFVRDEVMPGADSTSIPKNMTFGLNAAYDSNYILRNIYYVYEYVYEGATEADDDDVKQTMYTIAHDTAEGSSREIWYLPLALDTIGSLYFAEDGTVYEGGFAIDNDSYIFGPVGVFTYADYTIGYYQTIYFDVELDSYGRPIRFSEIEELENIAVEMSPTGKLVLMVYLVIRGDEAIYSEEGDFNDQSKMERCTIEFVKFTDYGEIVYSLRNLQGIEIFKMVLLPYVYNDPFEGPIDIWIYYIYNENLDKEFSVNTSGTLVLDGFHNGTYTDANGNSINGTYYLSYDGAVVYFVPVRGDEQMYKINGDELIVLDGIYGRYTFYIYELHQWSYLYFDGEGTITVYIKVGDVAGRVIGAGWYSVLRESGFVEGRVTVKYDALDGMRTFTVSFNIINDEENDLIHYESFELYEEMRGTFHNSNGEVLELDGYRTGTLTRAGSGYRDYVVFEVISREGLYITVYGSSGQYNILLDPENHMFSYPQTVSTELHYFSDSLGSLVIYRNGDIVLDGNWGFYSLIGDKIRVFFQDYEDYMLYHVYEWALPGGSTYTIENETYGGTYYRSTGNLNVTLTGTVKIEYEDVSEEVEATLTFNMPRANGDRFETEAVFTINGVTYNVDIISRYYDYETHSFKGLAFVDYRIYEYSPLTSYTYTGNGRGTFLIEVKAKTITMYDAYDTDETDGERNPEAERGSMLYEYSVRFGPLEFGGSRLSGRVVVNVNGQIKWLEFTDSTIYKVYEYGTDRGSRYMAIFEFEGTQYSIQYYKYAGDYGLYMITTYEELVADGYTVGVGRYYYSNVAYTMPDGLSVGDFTSVILFEGTGEDRTPIVAYNSLVNGDRKSAWLIDIGTYDVMTGTGDVGSIYAIEFADENLSSVTVKEYSLKQGLGYSYLTNYFANFYLDEDGKVVAPAAIAIDWYGMSEYDFVSYTSCEQLSENSWIFHATDGYDYVLTITMKDGKYENFYDYTDEYWKIEIDQRSRG